MLATIATANIAEDQTRVNIARALIEAMVRQDMPACSGLLINDPHQRFGPCPIKRITKISEPYVRGDQAYVTVTGEMNESSLPQTSYLMLCRGDKRCGVNNGKWMARMSCRHTAMVDTLRNTHGFESAEDVRARPMVSAVATRYLEAWCIGDYAGMQSCWYNWTSRDRRGEAGVKMTVLSATSEENSLHEPTVTLALRVQAPLLAFIHKTYHMTLVFWKEEGTWKVRGSQMEMF